MMYPEFKRVDWSELFHAVLCMTAAAHVSIMFVFIGQV